LLMRRNETFSVVDDAGWRAPGHETCRYHLKLGFG
jgi:hypothetical protein